jgi:hypothetical protein
MKTLLLGTDFIYNKEGKLVPLQINTAIGHNKFDRIENDNYVFDLTLLKDLIVKYNFDTIFYIGGIIPFKNRFSNLCNELGKSLSFYKIEPPSLTVPLIKDDNSILVVRSAYDTSAIIDDSYCRYRPNFLELIKDYDFGSEFAYIDYHGDLKNFIKNIPDNGMLPNFIIKSSFPDYDRKLYPKLLYIKTQEELKNVLYSLSPSYFLMPFYYNNDKLYNKRIQVIRSLNILNPFDLNSIPVGVYTKLTEKDIDESNREREMFLTSDDINKNDTEKEYLNEKIISNDNIVYMNDIMFKILNEVISRN